MPAARSVKSLNAKVCVPLKWVISGGESEIVTPL